MGILSELSQVAKAGRIEQLNAYLSEEMNSTHEGSSRYLHYLCSETPRTIGAQRRSQNHNMEISFASFR